MEHCLIYRFVLGNIKDLPVNVTNIKTKSVTLEWAQFRMDDDQRKLLAYSVYITEAPHQNLTIYDGRDACGQDKLVYLKLKKNVILYIPKTGSNSNNQYTS